MVKMSQRMIVSVYLVVSPRSLSTTAKDTSQRLYIRYDFEAAFCPNCFLVEHWKGVVAILDT